MTGLTTRALHSSQGDTEDGAIIPPIHMTTTFRFGNKHGYDYSRSGNPTRQALETTLAALDNARYALAYSSGSAALTNIAALLQKGQGILFSTDAYGGTYRYITQVLAPQGLPYYIADLTNPTKAAAALQKYPSIRIVWVETPTNPLLKVTDIRQLAAAVHSAGALLVVDNTFATPVLQQPLSLGADIVAYSTTKYLGGHSDSIGGSLALNDATLYDRLKFLQNAIGAILSPFDSWLTLRGLRTLELRMSRHVENTHRIADFLRAHPKIETIYFPAFHTGEQGRIVATQMSGPGAIISVALHRQYNVGAFLRALQYIPLAESLGGVESLIDHPASMTHASIPKADREKIGLTDSLFRISVGIENIADLLADLEHALSVA